MVTDARSRLNISDEELGEFCRKWKIVRLEVFGSALRDDFDPAKSDIDLLVTYAAEASWDLRDELAMQEEFEALVGRPADLPTRSEVERMQNWIRRRRILGSAQLLFEAHG